MPLVEVTSNYIISGEAKKCQENVAEFAARVMAIIDYFDMDVDIQLTNPRDMTYSMFLYKNRQLLFEITAWAMQTQEKGENRSWFRADSQNFPMVFPYLSCSPPSTFRSNNTIIHIIQQASTDLTVSFGIVIFNVNQAWLFIDQQSKSFRQGLKPNYILEQPIIIDWYASTIQIFYLPTIKLHLLIMSPFIQIPNRINQLTKKSKLEEIFTYAAIRSQIKDGNL